MSLSIGKFRLSLFSLILTIGPILAFWALLNAIVDLSHAAHEKDEEHLKVTTDLVVESLEDYFSREVARVTALTQVPAVLKQVKSLGAEPYVEQRVTKLDEAWRANDAVGQQILDNELSSFLKAFTVAQPPPYRELLIADKQGRLIAASNRTEDYNQKDDDWWPPESRDGPDKFDQTCSSQQHPCIRLHNVGFDPSADVTAFSLIVPIVEGNRVHGVLKAVIDMDTLRSMMDLIYSNVPLDARLLGKDGVDVFDPTFSIPADVREAVGTLPAGQEWNVGDLHLRLTRSYFQLQPWTIYIKKHTYDTSASSLGGLIAFAVAMAVISAIGISLVISSRVSGKPSESLS